MKTAGEELKRVHVGHNLSSQERDHLNMLLKKAKEKNESENSTEFIYKVRGPPFALKKVSKGSHCSKTKIKLNLNLQIN